MLVIKPISPFYLACATPVHTWCQLQLSVLPGTCHRIVIYWKAAATRSDNRGINKYLPSVTAELIGQQTGKGFYETLIAQESLVLIPTSARWHFTASLTACGQTAQHVKSQAHA